MKNSPISLVPPTFRRRLVTRRALRSTCQAVHSESFQLLGERVLDLSPYGMMLAADSPAEIGDEVMVSFQDHHGDKWFDAEAIVVRVIGGWREGDPGFALGLRFTNFELESRLELKSRLRGLPPPVPTRKLRRMPILA